jgi:long-chain acyl-CoA synthetase
MATPEAMDTAAFAAYAADERLRALVGPGAPFEVREVVLDGIPVRSFVRAPASIVDAFQIAKAHADLTHLVLEDERLTFAQVRAQALAIARRLRADFGVGRGDRVAIAMRNLPEFVVGFWSAAVLGAIVVPLNAWWTGPELLYAIEDCGAKVVFADPERTERLRAAGCPAQIVGTRVLTAPDGFVRYEELAAGPQLDEADIVSLDPDDPVTLLYTSGTTGRPKGALGTSRNHISTLMAMGFSTARGYALDGRGPVGPVQNAGVSAAPLFHIGGIAVIVGGAMSGSKTVLMRKWDVDQAIALAVREGVTSFGGVPAMARQILEHPDIGKFDLQVRTFSMGGAAVPPDLVRLAGTIFGDSVQLLNGYGSTETSSAVVTNVGAEYAARPDSVGRPVITADLRIEAQDGKPLGPGEVGELCFRSVQVVKGYWNDPAGTRLSFVDGWFHTGDVGYIDDDGFVYVVDRIKDVVIRGGENVYCAEVEAVLFEHPSIADVSVIGIPERAMGERVCAVVVLRAGANVNLDDLRSFAAARLARFKCPEALYVTGEVPRTPTGKTSKQALRAELASPGARIERTW